MKSCTSTPYRWTTRNAFQSKRPQTAYASAWPNNSGGAMFACARGRAACSQAAALGFGVLGPRRASLASASSAAGPCDSDRREGQRVVSDDRDIGSLVKGRYELVRLLGAGASSAVY